MLFRPPRSLENLPTVSVIILWRLTDILQVVSKTLVGYAFWLHFRPSKNFFWRTELPNHCSSIIGGCATAQVTSGRVTIKVFPMVTSHHKMMVGSSLQAIISNNIYHRFSYYEFPPHNCGEACPLEMASSDKLPKAIFS